MITADQARKNVKATIPNRIKEYIESISSSIEINSKIGLKAITIYIPEDSVGEVANIVRKNGFMVEAIRVPNNYKISWE